MSRDSRQGFEFSQLNSLLSRAFSWQDKNMKIKNQRNYQWIFDILMNLLRYFGDLLIFNKFVLSAKWWTLQCFMATLRSFMYIRKSNGPNTDPWETPLEMVDIFELKPLIETNCFWSVKYDSNHSFDIPLTP